MNLSLVLFRVLTGAANVFFSHSIMVTSERSCQHAGKYNTGGKGIHLQSRSCSQDKVGKVCENQSCWNAENRPLKQNKRPTIP